MHVRGSLQIDNKFKSMCFSLLLLITVKFIYWVLFRLQISFVILILIRVSTAFILFSNLVFTFWNFQISAITSKLFRDCILGAFLYFLSLRLQVQNKLQCRSHLQHKFQNILSKWARKSGYNCFWHSIVVCNIDYLHVYCLRFNKTIH